MMATDSRYEGYSGEAGGETRRRSGWSTCLVGCLVACLVALVVAAGAVFWISRNWRGWVSSGASQVIRQSIDESELPPQEKEEVKVQVDRVTDAFREGRLSDEQLSSIMQQLVDSPLLTTIVVSGVEKMYFAGSGLGDEEKAQGSRTLKRFVRGMVDGKIDQEATDAVLAHIADRQSDGSWRFRQPISDDELREFLNTAKRPADQAGIPEEPESFDPSDEIKRIIDKAMNEP